MIMEENRLQIVKDFVNGEFADNIPGTEYKVFNPAFGKHIASVNGAEKDRVDTAVEFANEAFNKWSTTPITERLKYLFKLVSLMSEEIDDIAEIITIEHGKTFQESKGEVMRAIENIQSACSSTYHIMGRNNKNIAYGIDEELFRTPIGVFAVIAPFNFPIMIPFWFVPYAVGLGNTIVVKPSEKVPLTMQMAARLIKRAGFPNGVISTVNGSAETVNAILDNKHVAGVSFIGSTRAGRYVYQKATSQHKRAQAGTSAKNYELVLPDAKLGSAIGNLISSFFGNTGQRCLAGSVLVTLPENHDVVVKAFTKAAAKIKVGYGLDKAVTMGPLNRKDDLDRVESYIEAGEHEGARLLLDGRDVRPKKYPEGYFIGPSVFDEVNTNMKIVKEEIFGPVACIMQAEGLDDAIEKINLSEYGNASTIFTTNGAHSNKFISEVKVGNVGVNVGVVAPIAFYPFGGLKDSFFGDLHAQGGEDHIMFFTERKVVVSRW